MYKTDSIKNLAPALLAAQKEMGDATKGASNPFFKSTYADLNSVREAVLPALHKNGFSVLQPTVELNGKNYVETVLLHETGEFISRLTEIKNTKGDAQSEGSGISYARRYGLQSLTCTGAVDDDGNIASGKVNESTMKRDNKTATTVTNTKTTETTTAKKSPGRPPKAATAVATPPALAKTAETAVTKLPTKVANGYSGNGTSGKTVNTEEW